MLQLNISHVIFMLTAIWSHWLSAVRQSGTAFGWFAAITSAFLIWNNFYAYTLVKQTIR